MPSLGEDTIFHVCQITYLCTVCDKRDNVTMNVKIENEKVRGALDPVSQIHVQINSQLSEG